ncbi:MAG: helix-turn-helix domain-containing protein [Clostridia bacterium]|nr:helix-turn-helix domain-containing protein [Clostridia bacterium]
MKCYVCGGEMRKAQRDIEANWKGRQLVFGGLEAWVCGSCGEQAYEPDDVRLMQNIMRGLELEEAPPEVMNVQEVADLLRVSSQTVYVLARSGKLPAVKVGREWRFIRDQLLAALQTNNSEHEAGTDNSFYLAARAGLAESLSVKDEETIRAYLQKLKDK